jgi:hypothetical protein
VVAIDRSGSLKCTVDLRQELAHLAYASATTLATPMMFCLST